MRNFVILCALLAMGSCGSPAAQMSSSLATQEEIRQGQQDLNHQVWKMHAPELAQKHAGEWTLIAQGKLIGSWPNFDHAWKAASSLPHQVTHAYLFRAGQDDVEKTFRLPPMSLENPNWVHFGWTAMENIGLVLKFPGNIWQANEKAVKWGEQDARLVLHNVSQTLKLSVRAVSSTGFDGELTLRPVDSQALDLGRFTAPLPAYPEGGTQACSKVILRLSIPELDVAIPVVAYVLPEYSNP